MDKVDFGYVTIEYQEPILYRRYTKSVVLDSKEIEESIIATEKLSNHKPYLALVDTRVLVDITPEGRKTGKDIQHSENVIALAVLVKWLGQRLTVKVVADLDKPPYPMEVFTDEDKAIKWLLEQKQKRGM